MYLRKIPQRYLSIVCHSILGAFCVSVLFVSVQREQKHQQHEQRHTAGIACTRRIYAQSRESAHANDPHEQHNVKNTLLLSSSSTGIRNAVFFMGSRCAHPPTIYHPHHVFLLATATPCACTHYEVGEAEKVCLYLCLCAACSQIHRQNVANSTELAFMVATFAQMFGMQWSIWICICHAQSVAHNGQRQQQKTIWRENRESLWKPETQFWIWTQESCRFRVRSRSVWRHKSSNAYARMMPTGTHPEASKHPERVVKKNGTGGEATMMLGVGNLWHCDKITKTRCTTHKKRFMKIIFAQSKKYTSPPFPLPPEQLRKCVFVCVFACKESAQFARVGHTNERGYSMQTSHDAWMLSE